MRLEAIAKKVAGLTSNTNFIEVGVAALIVLLGSFNGFLDWTRLPSGIVEVAHRTVTEHRALSLPTFSFASHRMGNYPEIGGHHVGIMLLMLLETFKLPQSESCWHPKLLGSSHPYPTGPA